MPAIPGFHESEITIATMTLILDHVRAIPALTGDMRPHAFPVGAPVAFEAAATALDPATMLRVPAGFAPEGDRRD